MTIIYQSAIDNPTIGWLQHAPSIKKDPLDIFSLSSLLLFKTLPNSCLSTPFLLVRRADLIIEGSCRSHHHRLRTKLYFVDHRRRPRPPLQLNPASTKFCTNKDNYRKVNAYYHKHYSAYEMHKRRFLHLNISLIIVSDQELRNWNLGLSQPI